MSFTTRRAVVKGQMMVKIGWEGTRKERVQLSKAFIRFFHNFEYSKTLLNGQPFAEYHRIKESFYSP